MAFIPWSKAGVTWKNPDVLQNGLNAGAEAAGGAALTGAAIKAGGGPVTQAVRNSLASKTAAQAPVKAASDFSTAIPASKSTPYNDADYQAARPYLEAEHAGSPIESVQDLRDAADSAIGKIEDQIAAKISQLPSARFKTNVTQDVTQALQTNQRGQAFVDAGLKDLEDFHFDRPKTLADADAIRRQLNLENQAVLAQNGYKVAVARASDPAFAAREAAAESLRDGIYKQLAANGMPEAQALRLDEGSLIKLRNAAQSQIYNGDKMVRSTAQTGPVRQAAKAITKSGATAAGAAAAGWPRGDRGPRDRRFPRECVHTRRADPGCPSRTLIRKADGHCSRSGVLCCCFVACDRRGCHCDTAEHSSTEISSLAGRSDVREGSAPMIRALVCAEGSGKKERSGIGRGKHPNSRKGNANLRPWPKGTSGNPGGLPGTDLAALYARRFFESHPEGISDEMADGLKGFNAYGFSILADRAYGKVKEIQRVEHTGADGTPLQITIKLVNADGKSRI
jgi:hypothetical protein